MLIFKISGMMCQHCRAAVEKTISALPGVEKADVSLERGEARVEGDIAPAKVIAAVSALGYQIDLM